MTEPRTMLTIEQRKAISIVAAAFGWDKRTLNEIRMIAWCAFHYYVERLR